MKKSYLFFLFLLCINGILWAQTTTSGITGKVVAGNESLPGATVYAIHEPSGSTYGTVTNVDGRFHLQGMRTGGPYVVEISYIGYQKAVYRNIRLQLGESYLLDVELKESASALDEIVVTASKSALFNSQRTGAAQNFTSELIATAPSIKRSIYD
ncbi:MAG: carboxypeptidase-like regulatory domain-containing protein, partial [Massilibacteroides sp.]|nr:carboxypeptidase-like regulatory domain-containing protein [Massilibacteroides sp.]